MCGHRRTNTTHRRGVPLAPTIPTSTKTNRGVRVGHAVLSESKRTAVLRTGFVTLTRQQNHTKPYIYLPPLPNRRAPPPFVRRAAPLFYCRSLVAMSSSSSSSSSPSPSRSASSATSASASARATRRAPCAARSPEAPPPPPSRTSSAEHGPPSPPARPTPPVASASSRKKKKVYPPFPFLYEHEVQNYSASFIPKESRKLSGIVCLDVVIPWALQPLLSQPFYLVSAI